MSTTTGTVREAKCPMCEEAYTEDEMVECTKCKKWIHYNCAKVGDEVADNEVWRCTKCKSTKSPSISTKKSNRSMMKMQLLDKEELLLKQQQELLARRRALLDEMSDDDIDQATRQEEPCGKPNIVVERSRIKLPIKQIVSTNTISLSSNQISSQQVSARQVVAKELPIFTGKPGEWPVFISSFQQTTEMCGYTKDENLIRLQRCLRGKARDIVEALLTLPGCVPEIIETLRQYFGRPEIIMKHYMEKIQKMPPPRIERIETIIEFAVAVRNVCATMEQAQLKNYMCNPNMMADLVDKLPPTLQLNWAVHKRTEIDSDNICVLGDWLKDLAADICAAKPSMSWFNTKEPQTKIKNKKEVLNVHNDNTNKTVPQNIPRKCLVCQDNCKSVYICKEFINCDVNNRWDLVKKINLCKQCLKRHPSRCWSPIACTVLNCDKKHHPLLHNSNWQPKNNNNNINENDIHLVHSELTPIHFRIMPVYLSHNGIQIQTYAFLDEGSSSTLLNEHIANQLGLQGERLPLCLRWSGTMSRQEPNSRLVNVNISGIDENAKSYKMTNVRTVQALNLPRQSLNYESLARRYPHLINLPVKSYVEANPGILIGIRNWHVAVPTKIKEADENSPIAAKCRLGWTVFSSVDEPENYRSKNLETNFQLCECQRAADLTMHELVKEYISVDSLGVIDPREAEGTPEQFRAKKILDTTTNQINNRYETGLLWRYEKFKLPDSRPMALRRMICLERRLDNDKQLKENITQQIKEYEAKGYIRKLTPDELSQQHERIWYLPIFPVRNPNKPEKIRLVWDAAAKVEEVSLNTLLMKGVDWNASLFGVLIRSREKKICIFGDIKEMYHQVKIPASDQHVLRFLWRSNANEEPDTYVMQVMTFGATCSPSCAQYIKNTNALKYKDEFPNAVKSIIESHYVDDFLESVDTETEAIQLAREVTIVHARAGFEIRNWKSNSLNVMKALNSQSTYENSDLNPSVDVSLEKVLGMWWLQQSDEFTFSLRFNKGNQEVLNGERRPTKREVLRILMSIYDPLGLIAHFLVYLKILLQNIWRSRIDWDAPVNDDHLEAWKSWLKVLPQVEKCRIPRCLLKNLQSWTETTAQLHIFMDASEQACATVAYIRTNTEAKIECSLLGAKTKVAPIKLRSVPRLELDAAVMGCRFAKKLTTEISTKISNIYFWSDSKTVLSWIKGNPHRYNKFVAFRVAEIQDNDQGGNWRYIPSKLNVADDATKWARPPTLESSERWFQGPSFLWEDESSWPKNITTTAETVEEVVCLHQIQEPLINFNRFSRWKRLLRTMAYVYRFLNIKFKLQTDKPTTGILSCEELKKAETILFRIAQRDAFTEELSTLQKNKYTNNLPMQVPASSPIRKLSPYFDDEQQLLRVKGRLDAATWIDIDTKRPIILPKNHSITKLLIQQVHDDFQHANNESVVNQLRQRYVIPKLRFQLKQVVKNCQWCKINKAKPCAPEMAPLPRARMSPYCNPFTFTGVDYFGPLAVSVGRRQEKRWGVLFTCLTTRAVHVEVAHKLDSDSFILCFQDFIQRRGNPQEIYCDRGTNFVGAEKLLRQELEKIDPTYIAQQFISPLTKWVFNPPASPHMGGAWERLVRSFKTALYHSLPTRTPSDPLLRSCLVAAENMINSRPLTYMPLNDELQEALTPNHFLRLHSGGAQPIAQVNDNPKILKYTYQYKERFANKCWERFIMEYAPELTLRSKWYDPVEPLKIDDIVIIIDKDLPRNNYPKGRVVAVKMSSDGQVRSATIQTSAGFFERPTVKLAKLEVNGNEVSTRFPTGNCQTGGNCSEIKNK